MPIDASKVKWDEPTAPTLDASKVTWDAPKAPAAPAAPSGIVRRLVGDTGASLAAGVGDVISAGGTLYGLASGNMDNAASRFGQSVGDYWSDLKSPELKAKEAARDETVAQVQGEGLVPELKRAGVALAETVTDPALLVSGRGI